MIRMKKFLLAAIAVLPMVGCSTIGDAVRYGPKGGVNIMH